MAKIMVSKTTTVSGIQTCPFCNIKGNELINIYGASYTIPLVLGCKKCMHEMANELLSL